MLKIFRIIFIVLLLAFAVLQFFQPQKNRGEVSANHILEKEKVPENIKTILQNACFDCHSNQTNYLWYHKIGPVSWMVNKHIVEGKDELNFSEWGNLDIYDKIGTLEKLCRDVKRKKMPIKAYTIMHKKAKLSDEQIAELCEWTDKFSLELISEVEN